MKKYDFKKELVEWIKFYNANKYIPHSDIMKEYDKRLKYNEMIENSEQYKNLMNKILKILNKTNSSKDISLGVTTDCTTEICATVYFDESTKPFEKLVKENKIIVIKASLPSGRWSCDYRWDFENKKVVEDAVVFQSMTQIQDAYDRMAKAYK
jgi:hypothetical protein